MAREFGVAGHRAGDPVVEVEPAGRGLLDPAGDCLGPQVAEPGVFGERLELGEPVGGAAFHFGELGVAGDGALHDTRVGEPGGHLGDVAALGGVLLPGGQGGGFRPVGADGDDGVPAAGQAQRVSRIGVAAIV